MRKSGFEIILKQDGIRCGRFGDFHIVKISRKPQSALLERKYPILTAGCVVLGIVHKRSADPLPVEISGVFRSAVFQGIDFQCHGVPAVAFVQAGGINGMVEGILE